MKLSAKTVGCQQELKNYIDQLDIAGYLRAEVYHAFEYMNYYKSHNLWNHREDFAIYLQELDIENSRLMCNLIYFYQSQNIETYSLEDCSYYLSSSSKEQLGDSASLIFDDDHPEIGTQALQIVNTLKAMLLFTITEYLHASALRMGIHSARMQLEGS